MFVLWFVEFVVVFEFVFFLVYVVWVGSEVGMIVGCCVVEMVYNVCIVIEVV